MFKKFLFLSMLALSVGALSIASSSVAADNKMVMAAADPYPPFVDPYNPLDGLSLEVIRAAFKTQGYQVKMEYVPWARAEHGVKDGVYDILPNVWHTEARTKELLYSTPYATNTVKFIKQRGDAFDFKGMDSLKGKRIGTIRDYGYSDEFNNSKAFVREDVSDFMQNIKKLATKRIDLTLEDEIVAKFQIGRNDPAAMDKIEFAKTPLNSKPLYIASGLKNPRHKELIDAFNKGFESIKKDGTLEAIFKKYGITL